jgi:Na+-transporting methylmalonyl-CoA/oxaloacetate decarboxylase beta subunit
MKPLISTLRHGRAGSPVAPSSDDSLGRGMDLALTLLVFLGLGALVDSWLGIFPVFTIALVLFAAVGTFVRMKVVYDATMERHEAELRGARRGADAPTGATIEGTA